MSVFTGEASFSTEDSIASFLLYGVSLLGTCVSLGTDMSCVWPPLSLSCDDLSPYDGADTPTAGSTEMAEMRTFSLRISNCGAVPIIP